MSRFGWAYIGAGDIAHNTARQLKRSENSEIATVWNRTYEKADKFAEEFGARACRSFEEAVNDPRVEGVYIALTNVLHHEYMKKCIALRKPVLCEKPFTVNAKEAKEIFELAQKEGIYVSEAMWTWHNTPALTVRKWVKEGNIGRIKEAVCEYRNPAYAEGKIPRLFDAERIGGALLDIGVYALRYSLELFGRPESVECRGRMADGVDLEEEVIFLYRDFRVIHHISLDSDFSESYVIKGEKGEISIPLFHMSHEAALTGEKTARIQTEDLLYERQFSNVAEEIRKGLKESVFITPEKTLECMEIMDECRRQMGLVYPKERI